MSNQWWQHWNQSASNIAVYPTSFTSGGAAFQPYAVPQLVPVLDSPSKKLSDRDWLDAQIAEVCELAAAA